MGKQDSHKKKDTGKDRQISDPDVRRWYNNMGHSSIHTASRYLETLGLL